MGERAKERSKKHNANRSATLCSLPVDILGDIVRSLDFQDKCSLELVARSLHALLSSPSAADGLWGRCDLMWDLKLDANFDKKDIIMRWLRKRLSGFTHLICNTQCLHYEGKSGYHIPGPQPTAKWLLGQLPMLSSNFASGCQLNLALTAGVASQYFGRFAWIRESFWAAMSHSLTELAIIMDAYDEHMWIPVLRQLSNLTSLKLGTPTLPRVQRSYVIDLPGLRHLHICHFKVQDLTLKCPGLRSLTVVNSSFRGKLSLEAPLEEVFYKGKEGLPVHEGFPLDNLLGVTRLHVTWSSFNSGWLDDIYGILPLMSRLKTLSIVSQPGILPPKLPDSLWTATLVLDYNFYASTEDLEVKHFADACELPQLKSLSLLRCPRGVHHRLQEVSKNSKAKIVLDVDHFTTDLDILLMEEAFLGRSTDDFERREPWQEPRLVMPDAWP